VYAPGEITITQINSSDFFASTQRGFVPHTDYQIDFSPCKEFHGRFSHVSSLSDLVKSKYSGPSGNCMTYTTGGTTIRYCSTRVSIRLASGEVIGTAGGPNGSNNLDFGAYDDRIPAHPFANPARWGPSVLRVVCPVDYFSASLRTMLGAKLGDGFGNFRTAAPVCGEVAQDKAGTAQGVWFVKGTTQTYPEDPHLALGHHNLDPLVGIFSVGTSMQQHGLPSEPYSFQPAHSGLVNRDFSEVTALGTIHCYETKGRFQNSLNPVIIVSLVSPTSLRMERLSAGICGSGPWSFGSGAVEFER
jgi:hypothetical protein